MEEKGKKDSVYRVIISAVISALLASQITVIVAWMSVDEYLEKRTPWAMDRPLVTEKINNQANEIQLLRKQVNQNSKILSDIASDMKVIRHILQKEIGR